MVQDQGLNIIRVENQQLFERPTEVPKSTSRCSKTDTQWVASRGYDTANLFFIIYETKIVSKTDITNVDLIELHLNRVKELT